MMMKQMMMITMMMKMMIFLSYLKRKIFGRRRRKSALLPPRYCLMNIDNMTEEGLQMYRIIVRFMGVEEMWMMIREKDRWNSQIE